MTRHRKPTTSGDTRRDPLPVLDARRTLGADGEAAVARWYRRRGYRVVERNWRCRNGEIDLIVRRDDTIVFCEVKTRSSTRYGHPAEAVTASKQRRIRQLALLWARSRGEAAAPMRFDVAVVVAGRVEVIRGAF